MKLIVYEQHDRPEKQRWLAGLEGEHNPIHGEPSLTKWAALVSLLAEVIQLAPEEYLPSWGRLVSDAVLKEPTPVASN